MPIPTRRLLILILLAAPLLALGGVSVVFFGLAGLYLGTLAVIVGLDLARSPAPGRFRVRRVAESKLSLGADNLITIEVMDPRPAGPPVPFTVRDAAPDAFTVNQRVLAGTATPRSTAEVRYLAQPPRRGDFTFGDTYLRVGSALGLTERQARHATSTPVKVYPNLLEVQRYELLARRGHLFELGLKNARRLGSGTEFERLREYQPDDDYRRINWPATARRGTPITMDFETERSQTIMILLDCGRLMAGPVGTLAKLDYAINTSLLLAFVGTLKGDRVGLLTFADSVLGYWPPARGRGQFLRLLEALYTVQAQPVEPDYAAAMQYFRTRQRKRSFVVLFTDVLDRASAGSLVTSVGSLTPHHLPLTVAVGDPAVTRAAHAIPGTSAQLYEREVAGLLLQERQGALEALAGHGALTLDVPAEELTIAVINRYLELKARGRI
jgi:uncharacterized protein (DUF58 family)